MTILPLIVGCAGRARAGKGTFITLLSDILSEYDPARRITEYAFATALKQELDQMLTRRFGISAFTVNTEHKKVIRPFLVERGAGARAEDPDYWIKVLDAPVRAAIAAGRDVAIGDTRYLNELRWVHSLGGKVIYIERIQPDGTPVPFANDEETRNDPLVEAVADIRLTWPTLPLDQLRPYVERVWRELMQAEVAS